jgi:hypothetical protein
MSEVDLRPDEVRLGGFFLFKGNEAPAEQVLRPVQFLLGIFQVDLGLFERSLAALEAGLVLLDLGLQHLLVELGHDLAGGDLGVEIGVQLDDLPRNLTADIDDVDRVDRSGRYDEGLDIALDDGFRPVLRAFDLSFFK